MRWATTVVFGSFPTGQDCVLSLNLSVPRAWQEYLKAHRVGDLHLFRQSVHCRRFLQHICLESFLHGGEIRQDLYRVRPEVCANRSLCTFWTLGRCASRESDRSAYICLRCTTLYIGGNRSSHFVSVDALS